LATAIVADPAPACDRIECVIDAGFIVRPVTFRALKTHLAAIAAVSFIDVPLHPLGGGFKDIHRVSPSGPDCP
jgi:hypothetical protein